MTSRWNRDGGVPRGDDYDARWAHLHAAGHDVHGEAGFVERVGAPEDGGPWSVLDAGCGTGRVAIELARRGATTTGVDLDPAMLATARAKAPDLEWIDGDLSTLDLGRTFDVVVMAGNVMIFVAHGTEATVVERLASHVRPGGLLVAGFQLRPGGYDLATYDADCAAAGLTLVGRFATWDGDPLGDAPDTPPDYAVSVHTH